MERIEREKIVVSKMIAVYCRKRHRPAADGNLCEECRGLLEYALLRLDRCRHGNRKPSCRKCPVHCYSSARRAQIREVMRYVGPRMILIHPLMALRHLLSELR